jgi:hypothetical protein
MKQGFWGAWTSKVLNLTRSDRIRLFVAIRQWPPDRTPDGQQSNRLLLWLDASIAPSAPLGGCRTCQRRPNLSDHMDGTSAVCQACCPQVTVRPGRTGADDE